LATINPSAASCPSLKDVDGIINDLRDEGPSLLVDDLVDRRRAIGRDGVGARVSSRNTV
jgi:hypothetical protein